MGEDQGRLDQGRAVLGQLCLQVAQNLPGVALDLEVGAADALLGEDLEEKIAALLSPAAFGIRDRPALVVGMQHPDPRGPDQQVGDRGAVMVE